MAHGLSFYGFTLGRYYAQLETLTFDYLRKSIFGSTRIKLILYESNYNFNFKFILASEKNLLYFSLLQASWLYDLLIDFLLFYGLAKEKYQI